MRVALIHNEDAGSGVYITENLARLLRDQGCEVDCFSEDPAAVARALSSRPSVVVVAGGDGTVAAVAIALRHDDTPMFILPAGTSNNIARAVGAEQPIPLLIARLATARPSTLDIGCIDFAGQHRRFVEAAGVGFIGTMLAETLRPIDWVMRGVRRITSPGLDRWQRGARGVARLVRAQPAREVRLRADGVDLSGEYIAVEIMNIAAIGPRICLAPDARPGDGNLDLALVRPADRDALANYVESPRSPDDRPPIETRRVRRVELDWPAADTHVDDDPWPEAASTAARPGRVTISIREHVKLLT